MAGQKLAPWLQNFAVNYSQTVQDKKLVPRTAGVNMESGNDGETKPTRGPLPVGFDNGSDDRQKAFTDSLQSVSISPNPKDEEQARIKRDSDATASDIESLANGRKRIETDQNGDAVKHHFYPHANNERRSTFARNDLAKIARAGANDILDNLEDVLQSAEEFVHANVPVGQREQVFASIEKALRSKGVNSKFARLAASDAPSSGFGDFTWNDVSSFIEDDWRTVPGDPASTVGGSPDAYNNGERTTTSIERAAIQNPKAYNNLYPSQTRKPKMANKRKRKVKASRAEKKVLAQFAQVFAKNGRLKRLAMDSLMDDMDGMEGVTAPPLGLTNPPLGVEGDEAMDMDFDFDESQGEEGELAAIREIAQDLLDKIDSMTSEEEIDEDMDMEDDEDMDMDMDEDMESDEDDMDSEDEDKEITREASRRSRFLKRR